MTNSSQTCLVMGNFSGEYGFMLTSRRQAVLFFDEWLSVITLEHTA